MPRKLVFAWLSVTKDPTLAFVAVSYTVIVLPSGSGT